MSWYNNLTNVFTRVKRYGTIKGIPTIFELERFDGAVHKRTYYGDDTNFVELQERNYVLNSVISKIGKLVSTVEFKSDSSSSALADKLNNPNNSQSKEEFLKEFSIYLLASGYTMIWKKYGSYGNFNTLELININPDPCVTQVRKNKIYTEINDKSIEIDNEDLIYFYDIKKNHCDNRGKSRIKPLKMQVININDAERAKNIQICKSGTTLVSPKSNNNANSITDDSLNIVNTMPADQNGNRPKTQRDDLEEKLNYRGIENRIIVASRGIDSQSLAGDLAKTDYYGIVEADILAIYDAFGFPPELSPYGKNATFENKPAAESMLIENEGYPIINSLTKSLMQEFPNRGDVYGSFEHLSSVAKTKNTIYDTNKIIADTYSELVREEIITKEEAKSKLTELGVL